MPLMTIEDFLDLSKAQRAKLRELNLFGVEDLTRIDELDIDQLRQFASALQDCQQLRTLELANNNLGALDGPRLTILGNALQKCLRLQSLDLSDNNLAALDGPRLTILGNALQKCLRLQSLDLSDNNLNAFDGSRLTILGNTLQRCLQLQSLNLNCNKLGDLNAPCLTILGGALQGCPQLQSLKLMGNNLNALDSLRLSILGNALRDCPQLQSVSLSSWYYFLNNQTSLLLDSILLNPNVFIIKLPNQSEVHRHTLKNHYLNSISKSAYQRSSLLFQPWQNGRKLPNELLRAVVEFEKTDGLLTPDYPVSSAEIDAAFEKGFRRAEKMRERKDFQAVSLPLTFSPSAGAISYSTGKKRQRNSQHAVSKSAKRHQSTKPKQVAAGRIMIIEDGHQVKRSCRLLNKKKRKR